MLERVLKTWLILGAALLLALLPGVAQWTWFQLPAHFFITQDLPVLAGVLGVVVALRVLPRMATGLSADVGALGARLWPAGPPTIRPVWIVAGAALGCGVVCLAGAHWIAEDYALTMDEFMARFGAAIAARGQLVAPLAGPWREFADALSPRFLSRAADGAWWASGYFPVNAALQGLGIALGVGGLVIPSLVTISVLAVFGVGRRLWPDRSDTALVAILLLATSSQFLVTGMTPYAMTAHLALNMVWLWLFLRGGWPGHIGAIAVGAVAVGLHQLLFHPLFVAPFVLQLWLERRWRLALLYTVAYGVICLAWIDYWPLALAASGLTGQGGGPAASAASGAASGATSAVGGFFGHFVTLITQPPPDSLGLMAKNLIRFVTWQNLLLAPLVVLGAAAAFRAAGTLRSMIVGLGLTIVAMALILPDQGHGWGYRYLHGQLGVACLLAAWTWTRFTDGLDARGRAGARVAFLAVGALSLFGLAPLRAWQYHSFLHPYAAAQAEVDRAPTPFVLVDDAGVYFGCDLVRNDPYLRNRPLKLCLRVLTDDQIRRLCAGGAISFSGKADAARHHIRTFPDPAELGDHARRIATLRSMSCGAGKTPVRDVAGGPI